MTLISAHFRLILLSHSGAIAGTPFDIDRELLRQGLTGKAQIIFGLLDACFSIFTCLTILICLELEFEGISLNSMDATGQRDFVGMRLPHSHT